MAIVAPMKAGKSTIINAIIGQEILPSRNSAMTTLPTEIIFDAERTEPVLDLSAEVLSVFEKTLLALRHKIEDLMKAARALAQEVFGIDWEEELKEVKIEDLQRKAERLLKKS